MLITYNLSSPKPMKKIALLVCFVLAIGSYAQTKYETLKSLKLDETRKIKIQLPRNYERNNVKKYPVILVLDGDYLFEPVAGNVDYLSYWEEMPEAIVVGVLQGNSRIDDMSYDDLNYLPEKKAEKFFEFLGYELLPEIDKNYRTSNFRIAVGHDITANFINYFLYKENSLFRGYINLSPDYAFKSEERLVEKLTNIDAKTWYYMATGSNDVAAIRENVLKIDASLKTIENENVQYSFSDFENGSHYTVAAQAIPKALANIFSMYPPISKKEYKEVILKLDGEETPYDYLVNKYETMRSLFSLSNQVRINDFIAVSTALEKKQDWESLEKLGNLARKEHPELMLGNYYLGTFYEQTGDPKKAMRAYENGFLQEEVAFLTKDMLLQKIERIKEDFGY